MNFNDEILPAKLFRYQPIGDELESVFTQNTLTFRSPVAFNDPFDSRLSLTADGSPTEIFEKIKTSLEKHRPTQDHQSVLNDVQIALRSGDRSMFENIIREMQTQFSVETGVLSFSEVNADILMWAHYANSHSGLCLEFTADRSEGLFKYAHQVIYHKDYPQVSYFLGSTDEYVEVLLTKSDHWSYEREWRVVVQNAANQELPFLPKSLIGVIFGHRTSVQDIEKVKTWIRAGHSQPLFYQAHPKKKMFGLDVARIE